MNVTPRQSAREWSRPLCFGQVIAAVLLVAAVTLLPATAEAQDASNELKLTTEKVIIFKDGHCLILKRAIGVTDDNGEVFTNQVPDSAVLGSFWATPKKGRLVNMTAGWKETEKEVAKELARTSTIEILGANVGKT